MGSGHCPDHTSAVPQEPVQDRLSAALNRNGLRPAKDTFQLGRPEKMLRMKRGCEMISVMAGHWLKDGH